MLMEFRKVKVNTVIQLIIVLDKFLKFQSHFLIFIRLKVFLQDYSVRQHNLCQAKISSIYI